MSQVFNGSLLTPVIAAWCSGRAEGKHVSYVEHGPGVDIDMYKYESDNSDVESD